MSLSCPDHPYAHLIEDHRAGDVICPECGRVVGDRLVSLKMFVSQVFVSYFLHNSGLSIDYLSSRLVDVGTEWRSFSNERSGTDPSRVGAPENPLMGASDLSTSIAVGFGSSDGDQRFVN